MSERGTEFLNSWVEKHIDANTPEGHADTDVEVLAASCLRDAEAAGLTRAELEDDNQTIEDVIRARMGAPTDGLIAAVARRLGS